MIKIFYLSLILLISGCKIQFRSSWSSSQNSATNYKRGKSNDISNIVNANRKIQHAEFKQWPNEYLNDIDFDIYATENGSRVAVQTHDKIEKKASRNQESQTYEKTISTQNLTEIMNKIDKLEWHDNLELNDIFIELQNKKINLICEKIQSQNLIQASFDLDLPKFKTKTIGSNSRVKLDIVNFSDISNWGEDQAISDAIESFARSCDVFGNLGSTYLETKYISIGSAAKWYEVCKKIDQLIVKNKIDNSLAQKYFEKYFVPIRVSKKTGMFSYSQQGTFTGYYELDLPGAREKNDKARFPIYALPPECKNGPCATRGQINDGKISGRNLEIYWAENPLDIFMLQIQGSGVVLFDDGTFGRIGFAGTNRQPGKNIFTYMKRKCIPKCNANLNEIITWFDTNPDAGNDLLATSDSYVFFRKLDNNGSGAIGAQGVPLTPSRSMAVDKDIIPYGTPLWLQTHIAVKSEDGAYIKMNRMLIAQDTGEAIKGAVRGDIFYGHGTKAKYLAEKQHFPGVYFMLVPKGVLDQIRVK